MYNIARDVFRTKSFEYSLFPLYVNDKCCQPLKATGKQGTSFTFLRVRNQNSFHRGESLFVYVIGIENGLQVILSFEG